MKRVLSAFLLTVLMLTITGCMMSGKNYIGMEQSDPIVESYRNSAQRLLYAGNYEGAAEVLKEGIEQTGSLELKEMLNEVNDMMEKENATQTATETPTDAPEVIPTEPPATQAPTEPVNTQSASVNLSAVQKRINVFLSNFSEAYFDTYPCSKFKMLSFAHTHALLNNDGKIYYGNMEVYMSEDTVNNILYKYFGITYGKNGPLNTFYSNSQYGNDSVTYDGEYYYYTAGAGEFYGYVTIATEMTQNSDGTYNVKYDVYSLVNLWEDDTSNYYHYTSYQARNSSKLDYCYSGVARVKDYTRSNGVQSYQLLEMRRN